jgi:hypothetical protein
MYNIFTPSASELSEKGETEAEKKSKLAQNLRLNQKMSVDLVSDFLERKDLPVNNCRSQKRDFT